MNLLLFILLLAAGATGLRAAPTNSTRVPRDVFALRPLEWIPSIPQVRIIPVAFPDAKPMGYIHALATTGERLWISAHPFGDTNLPPTAGRLWTFLPGDNRIDPATGVLEVHAVSGLQARGKQLWLMIDGGLARMDATTFAVDPFGSAQGIISPQPPAVAETRRGFFALGDSGALFRLSPDERTFFRIDASPPTPDTRDTSAWRFLAGSGEWLLAATERRVAVRHADAPRWNTLPTALKPRSPELDPIRIFSVCPDAEGGFWIGSDAGLGFLHAETGTSQFRERCGTVQVPGGLGIPIPTGMQPTLAAVEAARERVTDGIRERMKLRARLARASRETGRPIDAITPLSRIPSGVRALAMDHGFLWVATADPVYPMRSRILLFHPGSQKWVGWFALGFPVTTLAVDDRYLWVGADTQFARATPLYAVEKSALLSIPSTRWSPDTLDAEDIRMKSAALPLSERTVFAFFSGDYANVLRWTEGDSLTDEQWFLRALSFDPIGLNQPEQLALNLRRLIIRHPDSVFTGLATALLERTGSTLPSQGAPTVSPPDPIPTPIPTPPVTPTPASTPTQPPPPSLNPAAQASPQPQASLQPLTAPAASVNSLPVPTPAQPRAAALVASPISSNSAAASSPTNPRLPPPTNTPSIPGSPAPVNPALLALQRRDLNRDGKINIVELRLWLGSKADLKAWDQNGDQELDRQEFQAFFEANPNR
jgi:hypothetical protein